VSDPHFRPVPGLYTPVVAPEQSFDALLGVELIDYDRPGRLRARVPLRDELRGRSGSLHGGVIAAVAESLASRGTWVGVNDPTQLVMGLANETSLLAPLHGGHLDALALVRHREPSQWLWEVQSRDDDEQLCALSIVRIAVRAPRLHGLSQPAA
jgi:1,4-dihydroxy-2-naphthoyl-CoA hydrolase